MGVLCCWVHSEIVFVSVCVCVCECVRTHAPSVTACSVSFSRDSDSDRLYETDTFSFIHSGSQTSLNSTTLEVTHPDAPQSHTTTEQTEHLNLM